MTAFFKPNVVGSLFCGFYSLFGFFKAKGLVNLPIIDPISFFTCVLTVVALNFMSWTALRVFLNKIDLSRSFLFLISAMPSSCEPNLVERTPWRILKSLLPTFVPSYFFSLPAIYNLIAFFLSSSWIFTWSLKRGSKSGIDDSSVTSSSEWSASCFWNLSKIR